MVSDNLRIAHKYSPCKTCLVQPCCSEMCDDLLIYYLSVRNLIQLNMAEKGIDLNKEKSHRIYRKTMIDFLSNVSHEHKNTLEWLDKILNNLDAGCEFNL